jgi:AcrR family transcriptional regulator
MKIPLVKENYHHSDLKSDLIKKGLKILVAEGYEGFSLRKVARDCGVSQTAPYRHFKNKDELVLAIAQEAIGKFNEALQSAVNKYPDDAQSQLKEMGCAYIEFFVNNPEYLHLIFLSDKNKLFGEQKEFTNNSGCMEAFERTGSPFGTFYKTVERYYQERNNNDNQSMSLEELLLYCWGLVHGISILISRNEFPYGGDSLTLARKMIWNKLFADLRAR